MSFDDLLMQFQKQTDKLAHDNAQIVRMLAEIARAQRTGPTPDLTTHEVAELTGKAEFTVREWCRLGRINAKKSATHSGSSTLWIIAHEEYLRLRREGLLPIRKP